MCFSLLIWRVAALQDDAILVGGRLSQYFVMPAKIVGQALSYTFQSIL